MLEVDAEEATTDRQLYSSSSTLSITEDNHSVAWTNVKASIVCIKRVMQQGIAIVQ